MPNKFSYQGHYSEEEEESGYDEFALRTYDPTIGRWLGTDPYDEFASPYLGMCNAPVKNVDPDGGSIGSWVRLFLQALNLVRPATPAVGQFSGVAQATSLSGSTAAGTSGGGSTSGGLLNSLGNAAASALGQWVANKLLPMPQGPDARALQQIADLRKSMNAEPPYLQCGFATGNPAAALRTWKTTQKIAGWIEVLGGGPEDPVADVLAGGVEIVGGAISLYKAF